MAIIWKKQSQEALKDRIFTALEQNVSYFDKPILGVPASYLNEKVFHQDAAFLKDAPFLSAFLHNPNHIGCHTLGTSESFFQGTHEIERELIDICAIDILKSKKGAHDGHVASGGTEANIQAIWIYRNYFQQEFGEKLSEIVILCSEDSHYSMDKASNLLAIDVEKVKVDFDTRKWNTTDLSEQINQLKQKGKQYFIVVSNMMTTMFGSIDDVDEMVDALEENQATYKIHIDGAYGGFYYPFANQETRLNFEHPKITSFTLDAHKMAQSPYGTGIFLIRKGMMHYANTMEASYVEGEDYTLSGSRSGANAISVWMILSKNGPHGWYEKILVLQRRTDWLCERLDQLGILYYRNPYSNIVTIKSEYLSDEVAEEYRLVPDNHSNPAWFKIVVMEHVTVDYLERFVDHVERLAKATV